MSKFLSEPSEPLVSAVPGGDSEPEVHASASHDISTHFSGLDVRDKPKEDRKCLCTDCHISNVRNPDGTVRLQNPYVQFLKQDDLYHIALSTQSHDLYTMFHDTKFFCLGSTPERIKVFTKTLLKELEIELPLAYTLNDISRLGHRYSMYKAGPVVAVSHGMGGPSVSILLHELFKLAYHAKLVDPIFFKIGSCGGIGCPPGTVIVSEECCDGMMNKYLTTVVLGKEHKRPAQLDKKLVEELCSLSLPDDGFLITSGLTMSCKDFYEGQGRSDGAFVTHSAEDRVEWLRKVHSEGVKNIEMEGLTFASFTHLAGFKAAMLSVTLLDRLIADHVNESKMSLTHFQERPQMIVLRYIKRYLSSRGRDLKELQYYM